MDRMMIEGVGSCLGSLITVMKDLFISNYPLIPRCDWDPVYQTLIEEADALSDYNYVLGSLYFLCVSGVILWILYMVCQHELSQPEHPSISKPRRMSKRKLASRDGLHASSYATYVQDKKDK